MTKGRKRGRDIEKRERETAERPLVATLRSDSAACIYPFVSPCVILEREERRKRKIDEEKGARNKIKDY